MTRQQQQQGYLTLEILPDIPIPISKAQCIYFPYNNEIIICGGAYNSNCYSYHIRKKQYKFICSYPSNVRLLGHTVISYPNSLISSSSSSSSNNNNNTINILSFGCNLKIWHTLIMKYKSIWNDSNDNINNNSLLYNKWTSPPNNIKFGEINRDKLEGARALIGGSNPKQPLLFISHAPKNIDVIDLKSFQYLQNIKNAIFPQNFYIEYHSFIPRYSNNKKNRNEFILAASQKIFLIQYDEINNEFSQQILVSSNSFLEYISHYAYACLDHRIFIFGGHYHQIKQNNIWELEIFDNMYTLTDCQLKMPLGFNHSIAVANSNDSCIHIIGGKNEQSDDINIHYVINIWTIQKVIKIMQYWTRENQLKIGWITEFDSIITNYIY